MQPLGVNSCYQHVYRNHLQLISHKTRWEQDHSSPHMLGVDADTFAQIAAAALTPRPVTTIAGEEGVLGPSPDHGMRSLWSGLGMPAPSR